MAKFNGYSSRNAWNVSLWINNDYDLYQMAQGLVTQKGHFKAAHILSKQLGGSKTPDGYEYNLTGIKQAIADMEA